jgi:hypothetical protein
MTTMFLHVASFKTYLEKVEPTTAENRVETRSVSKELIECQQSDRCGLSQVCSYYFTYDPKCDVADVNCTKNKREIPIFGNIMLLKNGLNRVIDYTWDVVGFDFETFTDDKTARRYELPPGSTAYFDTNLPMAHTVRLINGAETVDTEYSSERKCTIHEACQYLLRVCESSFIFLQTSSMEPKVNCLLRAKACNYFLHLPDLSTLGGPMTKDNDEDSKDEADKKGVTENDEADKDGYLLDDDDYSASVSSYREGATACIVDCMWSWYPEKYLPTKDVIYELTDSLDVLRRYKSGLSLSTSESNDLVFTDDTKNVFHTTKDDELVSLLNNGREGELSHNGPLAVWLIVFLLMTLTCVTAFAGYIYYQKYYKEGNSVLAEAVHHWTGTHVRQEQESYDDNLGTDLFV